MTWFLYLFISGAGGFFHHADANTGPFATKTVAAAVARDWTDVSGDRHARATLLSRDGDKLSLRRTDGKLVNTTLSRLSAADRQYVATLEKESRSTVTDAMRSLVDQPAARRALERFAILELPAASGQAADSRGERLVPATLVRARFSREYLEDYVDRTIREKKHVTDNILGTPIAGESETIGETRLVLQPSENRAVGEIEFVGTVHSRTVGHNGPAVLHYVSDSTVRARKPIFLDDSGLGFGPATTSAPTRLQTTAIESSIRRPLLGRIVERVARRRDAEARRQAESITAQHTAATVTRDLDHQVNHSVGEIQSILRSKVPDLDMAHDDTPTLVRFRSTPDYVEMAMVRDGATAKELSLLPPAIEGHPDIAVRVHRIVLNRAIAEAETSRKLTPLLVQLLNAHVAANGSAQDTAARMRPADLANWSVDHDWLTFDFTDAKRQATTVAEANQPERR
jgi:SLA1 homology domain 1, SHD1